jgi:hypothetical protein
VPDEPHISPHGDGEDAARERELRAAALADHQHGVVARWQLRPLGFSDTAIDKRIASRRLVPIFRGVFAVGRPITDQRGWWMAAVVAGGPGAVLSHRSAAALWGLTRWNGPVEVTVARRRAARRGIRFHEGHVHADERSFEDRIPVTTVARTLLDLAAVEADERLEQAVQRAVARELTDRVGLPALLDRYPGRRGTARLRAIISDARLGLDVTKSELETDFRAFLRERDIPVPEANARLEVDCAWIEVDCLWRAEGVVAELDSRAHHMDARAFERDRERDRALLALGIVTFRITWRALHLDPDRLDRDLRAALARRAARLPSQ